MPPELTVEEVVFSGRCTEEQLMVKIVGTVSTPDAAVYAFNSSIAGTLPILGENDDGDFVIDGVPVYAGTNHITVVAVDPDGGETKCDLVVVVDPGSDGYPTAPPEDQLPRATLSVAVAGEAGEEGGTSEKSGAVGFTTFESLVQQEDEGTATFTVEKLGEDAKVYVASDLRLVVSATKCDDVMSKAVLQCSSGLTLTIFRNGNANPHAKKSDTVTEGDYVENGTTYPFEGFWWDVDATSPGPWGALAAKVYFRKDGVADSNGIHGTNDAVSGIEVKNAANQLRIDDTLWILAKPKENVQFKAMGLLEYNVMTEVNWRLTDEHGRPCSEGKAPVAGFFVCKLPEANLDYTLEVWGDATGYPYPENGNNKTGDRGGRGPKKNDKPDYGLEVIKKLTVKLRNPWFTPNPALVPKQAGWRNVEVKYAKGKADIESKPGVDWKGKTIFKVTGGQADEGKVILEEKGAGIGASEEITVPFVVKGAKKDLGTLHFPAKVAGVFYIEICKQNEWTELPWDSVIPSDKGVKVRVGFYPPVSSVDQFPFDVLIATFGKDRPRWEPAPLSGAELAANGMELRLSVSNEQLKTWGMLPCGEDDDGEGGVEHCSIDCFDPKESTRYADAYNTYDDEDAFALGCRSLNGWSDEKQRVDAKAGGNWADTGKPIWFAAAPRTQRSIPPWTARAHAEYIRAGGAVYVEARCDDKSDRGMIQNQADWLYIDSHGGSTCDGIPKPPGCTERPHNASRPTGQLYAYGGVYVHPREVDWHKDLNVVIFQGCGILDIDDRNGNVDDNGDGVAEVGTEGHPSPGRLWAATGPRCLLGYNTSGPSEMPGQTFKSARLSRFFARLSVRSSSSICQAWCRSTAGDGKSAEFASCAIDAPHKLYLYWDKADRKHAPRLTFYPY